VQLFSCREIDSVISFEQKYKQAVACSLKIALGRKISDFGQHHWQALPPFYCQAEAPGAGHSIVLRFLYLFVYATIIPWWLRPEEISSFNLCPMKP